MYHCKTCNALMCDARVINHPRHNISYIGMMHGSLEDYMIDGMVYLDTLTAEELLIVGRILDKL